MPTKPSINQLKPNTYSKNGDVVGYSGVTLDTKSLTSNIFVKNGYFIKDVGDLVLTLSDGSQTFISDFLTEFRVSEILSGNPGQTPPEVQQVISSKPSINKDPCTGPEGMIGKRGERGNKGKDGKIGASGPIGERGHTGSNGNIGETGEIGDINVTISFIDPQDTLGTNSLWVQPWGNVPEYRCGGCTAYSNPCWIDKLPVTCQDDIPYVPQTTKKQVTTRQPTTLEPQITSTTTTSTSTTTTSTTTTTEPPLLCKLIGAAGYLYVVQDTSGSNNTKDVHTNGTLTTRLQLETQVFKDFNIRVTKTVTESGVASVFTTIADLTGSAPSDAEEISIVIFNDSQDLIAPYPQFYRAPFNPFQKDKVWDVVTAKNNARSRPIDLKIYMIRVLGETSQKQSLAINTYNMFNYQISIKPGYVKQFNFDTYSAYTTGSSSALNTLIAESVKEPHFDCTCPNGDIVSIPYKQAKTEQQASVIAKPKCPK